MELDQLYKRLQKPWQERLDNLQRHRRQTEQRDDLVLEEATLLNQLGRYDEAREILANRWFHVWEGGEGKVSGQYQICRLEKAKQLLASGSEADADKAIVLLKECLEFPHNIGEGKLYGAQDNDFYYLLGRAYAMKGCDAEAERMYKAGTKGPTEPAAAMYYNDAKPDKIFYAALCYRELGLEDKAHGLFHKLISYGEKHLFDHVTMDYFAVSLPDLLVWDGDLDEANRIHCLYMLALGHYGLGNVGKARRYLDQVLGLNMNHLGALALMSFMQNC